MFILYLGYLKPFKVGLGLGKKMVIDDTEC